jgi:hypothetical protein
VKSVVERLRGDIARLKSIVDEAVKNTANYKKRLDACINQIKGKSSDVNTWKSDLWSLRNHKNELTKADAVSNVRYNLKWDTFNKLAQIVSLTIK